METPVGNEPNTSKPKTVAERVRAYRKRKKENDPEYQARENKRIADLKRSQQASLTEDEKQLKREKHAKRVKMWRLQKKLEKQQAAVENEAKTPRSAYKTPQSFGKAVRRLQVQLPSSPRKQVAAVAGLAKRVGLQLSQKMNERLGSRTKRGLTEDDENLIKNFFFRTDIVYTAPGLKEEMTVWECGKKLKLRKYYLVMYLKETYELFKRTHPDVKVGFSKFASLRPVNVMLLKDQSPDQCKCRIHENFTLKLAGLKIDYDEKFWPGVLCCDESELESPCWLGTCETCKSGSCIVLNQEDDEMVSWKQWEKSPETGRLKIEHRSGYAGQLKEELFEAWPDFQEHVRVKRIQFEAFEKDKSCPNSHVLQCDFAMAYSCEYQNEIQSALWSRSTVNLFTAALYSNLETCKSFLVVTDSQDKGKDAVYTFMLKLASFIDFKEGDDFIIYTDGPSSEFKNKYMVKLVSVLSERYGCPVQWKYFATSHGKGVVDGIGGAAKSNVRRRVMSKGANARIVQSSTDFAAVAQESLKEVNVLHVPQDEISEFIKRENPWGAVNDAPGISKVHLVKCFEGNCELFHTDRDTESLCSVVYASNVTKQKSMNLKVGDWVVVSYDDLKFPGEVIQVVGDDARVSVMHQGRKGKWFWPSQRDAIDYKPESIHEKIEPPVPVDLLGVGNGENVLYDFGVKIR